MRPDWDHVGRVLVVRLDSAGDVVLLDPALRALRARLPNAHITLLTSPAGAQVAPLLGAVDEVVEERGITQDSHADAAFDVAAERRLVGRLREGAYDAALMFTSCGQSPQVLADICTCAGIPTRLGHVRGFAGGALTHPVAGAPDEAHEVDRNLHLIQQSGIDIRSTEFALHLPAAARTAAGVLLAQHGVPRGASFIAMAPAANNESHGYPAEHFAEIGKRLVRGSGLPLVVVGGGYDAALCASVAQDVPGAVSLAGRTSMVEAAAVIEQASLLVGVQSGPMQLADAVGTPMVILYSGADSEAHWMPRRSAATLLRVPTPCSPCHTAQCPFGKQCLDVAPADAAIAALVLLGSRSVDTLAVAG